MANGEIHVGDVGTLLEVTVTDDGAAVDISSATTKEFKFKKTDRSTLTKAATFVTNGTDGKLQYTTAGGDLDMAGSWGLQVHVVLPSGEWHSDIQPFTVHPNVNGNG